jgi:hypothetical protein
MSNHSKLLATLILVCCFSTSYAITVNVQSSSKDISALGFTVNGKSHGGAGSSYSAKNMPTGKYSFGIRVGGTIFGTDIPCPSANGEFVNLTKDTNVMLQFNGKSCRLRML